MRTFKLKDLVYTVKAKQEILNSITNSENNIYLGLYPSLLMLGVRFSLPASMITYSTEPVEGVRYMRILGMQVITPRDCGRLLTNDIQTKAHSWSDDRRKMTLAESTILVFGKMMDVNELDIILHELDSDYNSLFDDFDVPPKDCWFFNKLESVYPKIIRAK